MNNQTEQVRIIIDATQLREFYKAAIDSVNFLSGSKCPECSDTNHTVTYYVYNEPEPRAVFACSWCEKRHHLMMQVNESISELTIDFEKIDITTIL